MEKSFFTSSDLLSYHSGFKVENTAVVSTRIWKGNYLGKGTTSGNFR